MIRLIEIFLSPLLGTLNSKPYLPVLPIEKERQYLRQLNEGCQEARVKLIEHNMRLVAHIAKKYNNTRYERDDLISIGTIGLIKAVDSFKIDSDAKLATYASRCIDNEILMKLRSKKDNKNHISLYKSIGGESDGNDIMLIDVIKDNSKNVIDSVIEENYLDYILKNLDILNQRELEVLEYRYGINNKKVRTQIEISKILNISRSYVSRIEKKALSKIYNKMIEDKLI